MNSAILKILLVVVVAGACMACSDTMPRNRTQDTLVGSGSGLVIGAGTGAIVGGTVSGAEAGTGALIGGGAGLIGGAVAGYAISRYSEEEILRLRNEEIVSNREALTERQGAIDDLRRKLDRETREIRPSKSSRDYHFTGETAGNPYR